MGGRTAVVGPTVGRETELDAVERFLDRVTTGPSAFVVEGEAGIGKTTLWIEGLCAAEVRGYRVLQSRPAESEARLSYAALSDLVGDVFDETRSALPGPQERALATALLRADADEPADPRTTATALVGVLSELAAARPLLVAIDDVQWLDPASERALEFAARRLPAPLGLLLTRRGDPGGEAPLGLTRALPEDRVHRLSPGPLSVAALHHLVRSRLGASLSRPRIVRIAEASGGNPFFALEIARAVASGEGDSTLADPLPVPRSLKELAAKRVGALSETAREAVLVAATLSRPTAGLVVEALPAKSAALAAIAEAEEAGVLVSERDRIRFTHPLLASAVYGSAPHSRRRKLHRQLAEVVADAEERARHLAMSVTEADERTAAELEHAARGAALRGGHDAAAELFAASRRLTPAGDPAQLARRGLGEAQALFAAGDRSGARAIAESAVQAAPAGSLRAEGLLLLSEIAWVDSTERDAARYLSRALTEAGADATLRGRIHVWLAHYDVDRTIEHADAAVRLLDADRDPEAVATALIVKLLAAAGRGHGVSREYLQRALGLEALAGPDARKSALALIWFSWLDEFEAARARHAQEHQWYSERGLEDWQAERLAFLALLELRAGRPLLAAEMIEASYGVLEQFEPRGPFAVARSFRALIDAHHGRTARARATLEPLVEAARRSKSGFWERWLLSTLAFVEFAAGDHVGVDRALTRMRELCESSGIEDALFDRSEPFHAESLLALGEPHRARETLARLEQRGSRLPRLWIDVTLPRTRAVVLASEGDLTAALDAVEELDVVAAARLPFELAWAWLVKGRLLRRLNQRRAAAETLGDALAIFERLDAPMWAEQTRNELTRVRPRRRAPDELTASELRVAKLAAGGLTNREVAKTAFMSAKTVEANLARVYRKLGIRSRAELGARMGDETTRAETKT